MKKMLFIILMLFVTFSIQAQKTYVLLLGVNNYGTGKDNLNYPVKDVKEIKQVLDKQKMTVAMLTSKYVTKENIDKKLDAIIKIATPKDKIIFYFSGHGIPDAFCCYGFDTYKYSDLEKKLADARTKHVFCFFDACYSGSVRNVINAQNDFEKSKYVFMVGCRPNEFSMEKALLNNGAFSQAAVKGLRGKADYNRDRSVTLLELFKYVYADVTKKTNNNQHPQLIGDSSLYNTTITKW